MPYNKELADKALQRMRDTVTKARDGDPLSMRLVIELADYMIPIVASTGPLMFDFMERPGSYPDDGPIVVFVQAMVDAAMNQDDVRI